MDPKIINYIKDHPNEANALAFEWQEFAKQNSDVLSFETADGFNAWAKQHPEKHIDTNIWIGKEIGVYLRRRQEDSVAQAQGSNDKKEERQREGARETPGESIKNIIEREERIPPPSTSTTTYQPNIQMPTRGFFNRGVGRGVSGIEKGSARLGGRVATRTGGMAGRLVSRLAAQAGMMVGRAAVQGVVAGAAAIGVVGWIVIVVIIVIIIIVFLIIMFAGGGGPAPTVECVDPDTGKIILVFDGNTCAVNLAAYYTKHESVTITAKCFDKCTDFVSLVCDRNEFNACTSPTSSCGGEEAFCIEYTPTASSSGRLYDCGFLFEYKGSASCGSGPAPTPTPAP